VGGTYRHAGVDRDAAERAVDLIREIASDAARPEVLEGVGGFAGLFKMGGGRLLAAATDGVGTKTEIARMAGRLDTVGIDLVAMCANDVVCTGAEPLFFLDYLAVGRLIPEEVVELVRGVAEGCRRAGCALLGGETAEHPGVMEKERFDLAGFCVGVVDEEALLGPARVQEGDALLGLPSSGLHANGFSLVRKGIAEAGLDLSADRGKLNRPLGEALLEPSAIYVPAVLAAARRGVVHSAAHITGGGLVENVPRALPAGLGAQIDRGAWNVPTIFRFIAELADVSEDEMLRTFNMGLGMVLAVPAAAVEAAVHALRLAGSSAIPVGRVVSAEGVRFS
jgi:phosphoribosylformylglycinamidine cyclo-ligase